MPVALGSSAVVEQVVRVTLSWTHPDANLRENTLDAVVG